MQVLLIAVGGSIGAVSRYVVGGWVSRLVQGRSAETFPWGTLAVNVLGCLVMGLLARGFMESSVLRYEYRMAILVGVLGAFTTWSTFGYEAIRFVNDGQFWTAGLYVLLTNLACLAAVLLGYRLMERLVA